MTAQTNPDPAVLNLGCGDDYHADAWNVDVNPAVEPDELHDLGRTPWPWADDSFAEVRLYHVLEHIEDVPAALREAKRVLRVDGRVVVKWPIGLNERADPDHKHQWVWDTPLFYCGERAWDVDVGLSVTNREVELMCHANGVTGAAIRAFVWAYERQHGSGWWQFDVPFTSGEFTVVFTNE